VEPSLGRHQYAPVAKKKTWMAIQRVRKNRWAITMPRHRFAISLTIVPSMDTTNNTAAARVTSNPLGAGAGCCSKNCGTGGCGGRATAMPLIIVAAS
jgi:hypothetical protein